MASTASSKAAAAGLTPAQVEELSARAWALAVAPAAGCPPLDLLCRLWDGRAPAGEPALELADVANVRFLTSDEVQTLVRGTRRLLRLLAQTTQAEIEEGRVPPGLIDWPATLRARAATGGDLSGAVLARSEVHRDLPETRLLKFLLAEIRHRADAALATHHLGEARGSTEALALTAGRLAGHELLRPVPATFSRQGYLHARAARIAGYRAVARAYELHEALFGRGDEAALMELFRDYAAAPRSGERAFMALAFCRLAGWIEAHGARLMSVHLREPGQGLALGFATPSHQVDLHFDYASQAPTPPDLVARVSNTSDERGRSSAQTALLAQLRWLTRLATEHTKDTE